MPDIPHHSMAVSFLTWEKLKIGVLLMYGELLTAR